LNLVDGRILPDPTGSPLPISGPMSSGLPLSLARGPMLMVPSPRRALMAGLAGSAAHVAARALALGWAKISPTRLTENYFPFSFSLIFPYIYTC
jgi:hypothetical protein